MKNKSTFSQRLRGWLRLDTASEMATTTEIFDIEVQNLRTVRLPDSIQDRYKVIRVLGRGAFGIVLLARDLLIGRLISIKILYKRGGRRDEVYKQFLQEARIAGQIEHPNIVTIYDVHDDRRCACIIMEYLAGGNLSRMLEIDGPLPEETVVSHMLGIVDGLRAAHQMGVIHRDIKPQNVLFDQNGNPVISDFGVAQMPLDSGLAWDETETDTALRVVGTPEYMAPEQMIMGAAIDGRADLYAAGLLMYEMLTGGRLFSFGQIRDIDELIRVVQKADPEQAAVFPPTTSAGIQEIVLKLIQKNPNHRYPDARSVLMALETQREALSRPPLESVSLTTELAVNRQEMFQDILRLFLVDGVISSPERRELAKRAERLGVKPEIARKLEEQIRRELDLPLLKHLIEYESMVERLLSDRDYSPKDKKALETMARKYQISEHEQRKIQDSVMVKFHMKEE